MTDSVNCSALAESMRRAMCDMLVSEADMGREYDTRNRTSPKVMGRLKNTEPRSKTPARRSGPQRRRETAEAPRVGDHAGPRVRYVRQGRLGFGAVRVVAVVQGRGDTVGRAESAVGLDRGSFFAHWALPASK